MIAIFPDKLGWLMAVRREVGWRLPAVSSVLMVGASLAVRMFPLPRAVSIVRRFAVLAPSGPADTEAYVRRLARSIEIAARYNAVASSCLMQAVVAFALLRRRQIEAELVIGVLRREDRLEAHAWVNSAGRIIVGDLGGTAGVSYRPLYHLH
jgi:hypothetical protein